MEALFHLGFELIKIGILASIYSWILLGIFRQINRSNPKSWFQKSTVNGKRFWVKSTRIIYLLLFIWMYTYWGNHGFGDSARIPIGNGKVIKNINWSEYGYIENIRTSDNDKIETTKFRITNKKLIGNLDSWFYSYTNQYFLYEIRKNELVEFGRKLDFDKYAESNDLPTSSELLTFEQNYSKYWSGWRFWLLP